jgi:hypothetical protein
MPISRAERLCKIRHLLITKGGQVTLGEWLWLQEIVNEFGLEEESGDKKLLP